MLDDLSLIRELISSAVDRPYSIDIDPEVTVSLFVHDDQLDAFNAEFGLKLPQRVRGLYSESDGFGISWYSGDDWGDFTFPSLYVLRLHRQRWVSGDMPGKQWTTHLEPDVAKRVLAQMESWLPFDESDDGDLMCDDCSNDRVIEYDHESGNLTEHSGTIYAMDLHEYVRQCARICFHSVWLAHSEQVLRGDQCWVD